VKIDGALITQRLSDVAATARRMEADGYDGVFTFEGPHDPFLPLILAAEHSERLELTTAIAVAFARSPMTIASTANDLHAVSKGRFVLGLGTQIKPHIENRFSMPWSHPAPRLRELTLAVRAIWTAWNERVPLDFRGEFYRLTLMTPFFDPGPNPFGTPRVVLAGVGPLMTEVAGEVGDGFIVHPFSTAHYLRTTTLPALERGLTRAGRARTDFEITFPVMIITGDTADELETARFAVMTQLAFYGSTPAYRPVLDAHGWSDLQPELQLRTRRGEWDTMAALLPEELVDYFTVSGRPEEIAAQVTARYGGLVDRVAFNAPYPAEPEQWVRVLAGFRETFASSHGGSSAMPSIETERAVAPRRPIVSPSTFAINGAITDALAGWFVAGLCDAFELNGYRRHTEPRPDTQVVLHIVDPDDPKPYRRRAAPTFVVAIGAQRERPADLLRTGYPLLVRALANLTVIVSGEGSQRRAEFVTLEQGTYGLQHGGTDRDFFRDAFERLEPLATSRLVIANEFRADLPETLWGGDEHTAQIRRAGERLAALDLLPAAFPIEEILPPRDLRHVKLLFGIGGLSYGNVSTRRGAATGPLGPEYWMSASGVDKERLHDVGRDVLLVRGYDPELDAIVLSVPPNVRPRRVSVDAIEHWMIYREHPEVGAILHVHAWMEGIDATHINYPCGTLELAESVAELVRQAPDPSRAVVGQRNHGLTITGHSLDEIFERIDGRLLRNVPMD
jgi:probable F420-dependent oxidoreductase